MLFEQAPAVGVDYTNDHLWKSIADVLRLSDELSPMIGFEEQIALLRHLEHLANDDNYELASIKSRDQENRYTSYPRLTQILAAVNERTYEQCFNNLETILHDAGNQFPDTIVHQVRDAVVEIMPAGAHNDMFMAVQFRHIAQGVMVFMNWEHDNDWARPDQLSVFEHIQCKH